MALLTGMLRQLSLLFMSIASIAAYLVVSKLKVDCACCVASPV